MNKTFKKYLFFLAFTLVFIALIDHYKPRPINWSTTLDIRDQIPFGLFVFNEEFPQLIPTAQIHRFEEDLYIKLDSAFIHSQQSSALLLIDDDIEIDPTQVDRLIEFAREGNQVWISSTRFPSELMDRLKFDIAYDLNTYKSSSWTANTTLHQGKFDLDKAFSSVYFDNIDDTQAKLLGFQYTSDQRVVPNFIQVNVGQGAFFLHSQPLAFSNYSLLHSNNHRYVENVLSYMNATRVYWKVHRTAPLEVVSSSPMRFVLQEPALKWAWYFFLLGGLLFVIFTAKRKQRIVPELLPLENTSVAFVKSVSNLYQQAGNHRAIVDQIIKYTLEKVRRRYQISTVHLDPDFVLQLQKATQKEFDVVEKWVNFVKKHQESTAKTTEKELIAFNQLTEEIFE